VPFISYVIIVPLFYILFSHLLENPFGFELKKYSSTTTYKNGSFTARFCNQHKKRHQSTLPRLQYKHHQEGARFTVDVRDAVEKGALGIGRRERLRISLPGHLSANYDDDVPMCSLQPTTRFFVILFLDLFLKL
jgi:hypothetical protein